jgi:hypothetical protein
MALRGILPIALHAAESLLLSQLRPLASRSENRCPCLKADTPWVVSVS